MKNKVSNLEVMKKILSLIFCFLLLGMVYGLISALWIGLEGLRIALALLILICLILYLFIAVDKVLMEHRIKECELNKELFKHGNNH